MAEKSFAKRFLDELGVRVTRGQKDERAVQSAMRRRSDENEVFHPFDIPSLVALRLCWTFPGNSETAKPTPAKNTNENIYSDYLTQHISHLT